MKTKSMIAGMLSVMMLAASCNKDENGGTVPAPAEGTATYASFSVSLRSADTRAASQDANAADEETAIGELALYIFNGGVLETTGTITLNADNEGTTALATTTGAKTIYAVANKTADLTGAVGSLQSDFEKQMIAALSENIAAEDKFFMVGSTAATLTEQTEQEAVEQDNLIQISVARGAAKVQMQFKTDVPVKPAVNAAVANAKFSLAQQNSKMYVVREADEFSPAGLSAEQNDENTDGTYDHLVALPATADIVWTNALAAYDNSNANSQYLAENVNETPTTGNTSYVLVGVQVTPGAKADANGDVTDGGFSAGDTFFVVSKTDVSGDITFASKDNKILYFADNTSAADYLTNNAASLVDYEVTEYTDGMSYYRLNIRDIKETAMSRKYAVLRNRYYKVNISEISNLGFNTPEGTVPSEPETPLETQTYISAEITIEPWTVVEMNEPLG